MTPVGMALFLVGVAALRLTGGFALGGVIAGNDRVTRLLLLMPLSIVAAVIALAAIVLPTWPYSTSVDAALRLDLLWISGTWKQVTGFTLVGLAAIVAFLSIRKRIGFAWMGNFNWWRLVHAAIGATTLAVLFIHTGFNLGSNLNQWLMVTFLVVAFSGSVTGMVTAREHKVLAGGKRSRRNVMTWIHMLALWPLPLLLALHVMTVYAY